MPQLARLRACTSGQLAQCRSMMHYNELVPAQPALVLHADRLRLAVAAYLARFKDTSRDHADSDLRCYLTWCADRSLYPFLARRPHLELYLRWMQEVRRFKPSTVSRRFSVTAGFYRTCVIDGVLEHSPAEHVRRPAVPAESPTPGFTHLQFEALLTLPAGPLTGTTSPWWPCWGCWACGTCRSRPATQTRGRLCAMTGPARTSTAIRTTPSPPTWGPAPDQLSSMKRDRADVSESGGGRRLTTLGHTLGPCTPGVRQTSRGSTVWRWSR